MGELIVDYEVNAKYKDSTGQLRFINRKSKKGGENVRRAATSIEFVNFKSWLMTQHATLIQSIYKTGLYDRIITNRRRDYMESGGSFGISKTEALEWYRFIYSHLSKEQVLARNQTYDNFTNKELGVVKDDEQQ